MFSEKKPPLTRSRWFCVLVFWACCCVPVWAQTAWVVGQSAPLTGGNAAFGKDVRDGAAAYFKSFNATPAGKVNPIELVTLDDRNERKQAGENAKLLLDTKKVVALFGFASATLSLDAIPLAQQAGALFFAPFSGADAVRKPNPVVFTLRASYAEELEKMVTFWTSVGMSSVAVVHYDDEVGQQNFSVVSDFLAKQGKKPSAIALKRNQPVEAAQIDSLIRTKPDVIIVTVLSGAASQIAKGLAARKLVVPMSSLSFVGAQQFIVASGSAGAGVSIAQVVPGTSSALPVVRECAKAMRLAGHTEPMNSTQLEACIGAKVLTEALRRSKKLGGRAALLASMQSLGRFDTGGFTVFYSGAEHHGSAFVELAVVSRDGKLRR